MLIGRGFRDILDHVPVLDNLALVEPEDIHHRAAPRSRLPHAMGMDDHIVAVREDALDLEVGLRKFVA
jgi:hypothetical protein